jgi:putative transposase
MANRFRVEVQESEAELRHRLGRTRLASSKERLQMLLWIKTKRIQTRQDLCQRLGRDASTIYRWVQRYYAGGIDGLLEVKTAPGAPPKIPASVVAQLQERLTSAPGFASYGEIQQWLAHQHGVKVAYRTVHERVRYKLKAKLKVPRPVSPPDAVRPGSVSCHGHPTLACQCDPCVSAAALPTTQSD